MEIFGFNFKSKAEKEKEARDYMERVFPGGEKEREQVRQELTKRLPEKRRNGLVIMLCPYQGPDDWDRAFF